MRTYFFAYRVTEPGCWFFGDDRTDGYYVWESESLPIVAFREKKREILSDFHPDAKLICTSFSSLPHGKEA